MDADTMNRFWVAHQLHMTVEQVETEMSASEFVGWVKYFKALKGG